MSNEAKYIALSESFTDLLDEIKTRTAGGLDLNNLHDNEIIVRDGDNLESVGVAKNVAPRDLYAGPSIPLNTLGKDGDLYFRTHVAEEKPFKHAAWSQGVTVGKTSILMAANTNTMMRTTDGGETWDEIFAPGFSRLADIDTNGSGVYVAVGYDGDVLRSTDDGLSWSLVTTLEVPENALWARYHSVSYGNGQFVASRQLQNAVSTDNGATWTIHETPTEATPNDTTYGASGGWVSSFFNADYIMQSADGVNWTRRQLPLVGKWENNSGMMDWARVGYYEGRYVIPAWSSDVAVWSDDGVTWNRSRLPIVANWSRSAYGDGVLAISADAGDVLAVSFDKGKTWSSYILNSPGKWVSIIFVDGKFILTEDALGGTSSTSGRQLVIKSTDLFATPVKVSIGGGDHTDPFDPLDPYPEPDPDEPTPEPAPAPVHPSLTDGNYCKTPNTDLAQLAVFFTTGSNTGSNPRIQWVGNNPQSNVGSLWNVPTGVMELRVYPDASVELRGTKADMSRIGTMKGGFATFTIRDNQCNAMVSRTVMMHTWDELSPSDVVTLTVDFPDLKREAIIDNNQRYLLEIE